MLWLQWSAYILRLEKLTPMGPGTSAEVSLHVMAVLSVAFSVGIGGALRITVALQMLCSSTAQFAAARLGCGAGNGR